MGVPRSRTRPKSAFSRPHLIAVMSRFRENLWKPSQFPKRRLSLRSRFYPPGITDYHQLCGLQSDEVICEVQVRGVTSLPTSKAAFCREIAAQPQKPQPKLLLLPLRRPSVMLMQAALPVPMPTLRRPQNSLYPLC